MQSMIHAMEDIKEGSAKIGDIIKNICISRFPTDNCESTLVISEIYRFKL